MLCLDNLRKQIDNVDKQIAKLLDHRMKLCAIIGQAKKQKELPIESNAREKEILNNIKKMNLTHTKHIQAIMLSIFNESKDLQKEVSNFDL